MKWYSQSGRYPGLLVCMTVVCVFGFTLPGAGVPGGWLFVGVFVVAVTVLLAWAENLRSMAVVVGVTALLTLPMALMLPFYTHAPEFMIDSHG